MVSRSKVLYVGVNMHVFSIKWSHICISIVACMTIVGKHLYIYTSWCMYEQNSLIEDNIDIYVCSLSPVFYWTVRFSFIAMKNNAKKEKMKINCFIK